VKGEIEMDQTDFFKMVDELSSLKRDRLNKINVYGATQDNDLWTSIRDIEVTIENLELKIEFCLLRSTPEK
jgi:hypothetical protein